LTNNHVTVF